MTNAAATANAKPLVRCAIYTRKSTDEGLESKFNSLDAQQEYCQKYIAARAQDGWYALPEGYDDGGYTGSNTDRPAFARLLNDVKAGLVDMIVVHRSDRISRSTLDFLLMNKLFETHKVKLVSTTETINMEDPYGEFTSTIIMSVNQLERAKNRLNVIAKIAASKKKGMWLGGNIPFGYAAIEKKLVIDLQEAEIVRLIFNLFLQKKSLKQVAVHLRELNIRTKAWIVKKGKNCGKTFGGAYFNLRSLYTVVNNPSYIGKVRHKGNLYDGEHPSIITDEVWQAVRDIISVNHKVRANISRRKVPAILQGLLKCGGCDSTMTPSHTRKKSGKLYRYYVPNAHHRARCNNCPIKQLSAPEIENVLLSELHQVFHTPELLVDVWKKTNNTIGSVTENTIRESISGISTFWSELWSGEQHRLLKLMVEKVVVQQNEIEMRVRADNLHLLLAGFTSTQANKCTQH